MHKRRAMVDYHHCLWLTDDGLVEHGDPPLMSTGSFEVHGTVIEVDQTEICDTECQKLTVGALDDVVGAPIVDVIGADDLVGGG